jgi:Reverse transcriptase (RNA-dependent DNA polymerase)
MKAFKDELMMVALYVDNMIFMDNNQRLIDEFKTMMKLKFEMAGLKMMRYVRIFISQRAYIWKILQNFRMKDYNLVVTLIELDVKLSKLEGGEVVDSNTYWSMIEVRGAWLA